MEMILESFGSRFDWHIYDQKMFSDFIHRLKVQMTANTYTKIDLPRFLHKIYCVTCYVIHYFPFSLINFTRFSL